MAGLIPFNRKRNDVLSTGFDDFQNMLDDFFSEGFPMRRSLAGDTFKIDVQDQESEYIIEAEIPGVQKNELNVSLEEGKLKITVNKEERTEENNKNYIHRERRFSSMQRNILLTDADPDNIKAKLENGVLIIHVPKKQRIDKSMKVEIE
jgi:HSP20 family protein